MKLAGTGAAMADRDRPAERDQPRVDAAWRKAANEAGVVILDTEAVDRDGKRGWIVVPMAAAEAITKPDTQRKRT